MADDAVPAQDDAAPASEPVAITPEQINDIISKGVQAAFDARIPGLMSVNDKKVAQLQGEMESLRRSGLSPEEAEEEDNSRLASELAAEKQRVAALEAARKYPRGFDIYDQVMQRGTVEEQLAYLESYQAPPAPEEGSGEQPEPTGTEPTPPNDPNNPRRADTGIVGIQTEEQAFAVLDQYKTWPSED